MNNEEQHKDINQEQTPDVKDIPTSVSPTTETQEIFLDEPSNTSVELGIAEETANPLPEPALVARKEQNVFIDAAVSVPKEDDDIMLSLPSDTNERTMHVVGSTPNLNDSGTAQSDKWTDVVRASLGLNSYDDVFLSTLEDPSSEFHQKVNHNNKPFGSHEVGFREQQNAKLEGEVAILRTISHLGLGSTWNCALWNTGMWITFKPPTEESLVELYRQITADNIELGRESYGLAYSNSTVITTERLTRFALQHVYRINSGKDEIGVGNALDYIKVQDISSLLWGFACTMFPKGFGYHRACMVDPAKCKHVVSELLNLRKLQVVNSNALTDRQKSHMAEHRGQAKMTIADLKLYESEMIKAKSHYFVINEGKKDQIAFNLRSPSINEYIVSGHRWIDEIVNNVEQALGSDSSFEDRNKQIDLRARATIMRQYSHWIESIEFNTNTIEDRATIESVIASISRDHEIRETFLTKIKWFIENSSVSVIGIPTYDCPKCGKANEGPVSYPHRTSMIPIDVIQLFIALLSQKHRDLRSR